MLLEELLTIPVFLNAQLIAGHNGLSRIVHAVRIIDAREPDVSFKQGDLLVADHSELQTSPHLLADLLKGTTLADCSGLALNGSPAEPDIDAELLREADRLNFPIIAVSAAQRTSPGDIYQQATNCILEYKHDELQHALTIQKEFSALIMRQSDAEEIIDRLAQLLSAPILLLNAKLEWKACSHQAEQLRLQPLSDELSTLLRARRIAAGTPIFQ
jgi:purine catabolism regulator